MGHDRPFRNHLCVRPHHLAPPGPPILCDRCAEEVRYLPEQQLALKLEEEAKE